MHARATGEKTADGKGSILNTDEKMVFSGLGIWLRAFFPIHALFCEAFQLDKAPVGEPYKIFLQLVTSLGPILRAVDTQAKAKPEVIH